MKRLLVTSVLLLSGSSGAFAGTPVDHYRDLIRPHGHARSEAIFQANLDHCYAQTGADRTKHDTAAFKKCMSTRGYRWRYASTARTPARRQPAAAGGSPPFEIGFGGGASLNDSPSPPSNPAADIDAVNQMNAINQMNAAAQDQVNAGIAATIQNEVLFNTVYFPPN